jgi:AhpD family alkylhydroperoxidase
MSLDDQTKELIAIGASVTTNGQSCLQYHVEQARKFGAVSQTIAGAIKIGRQVRRGASAKMGAFAGKMTTDTVPAAVGNVCCG